MTAYPDTSFLFGFYIKQTNSPAAAAHAATMKEPLHVTALLVYEFRQALRFQVWRYSANQREGIARADAQAALHRFETDLANGLAVMAPCSFEDAFRRAEELSVRYTSANGHRSMDVLHVATALHLRAHEFLTFDANQRKLATAESLVARP